MPTEQTTPDGSPSRDLMTSLLAEIAWGKLSAARTNGTLVEELAALTAIGYERGFRAGAAKRDTP